MDDLTKRGRFQYLPWIICGLGALFYFYAYLLRVVPSVIAPQLLITYRLDAVSLSNLAGIYYYVYLPMQIIVGLLLDRFNPRILLASALVACGFGNFLFANSESLLLAYVGRVFVGLGSAFAFIGVLKMACIYLPIYRFAFITGAITSFGMLGGIIGNTLLTSLVNYQGWRLANYSIATFGVLVGLGMLLMENRELRNLRVFVPTLKEVLRGLLALLCKRQIWVNCTVGCLLFIPLVGFADFWGVSYLVGVYHLSPLTAAEGISLIYLGWFCGAPFVGWISDSLKSRRMPLTVGATFSAILLSVILYVPNLTHKLLFLSLFFLGLFGSAQVIVFSVSRELSPHPLTATAIALTNTVVTFSGVSLSLIGVLLNLSWSDYAINRISFYAWNYQLALGILPLSLIVGVFLTFYLEDTNCKRVTEMTTQKEKEISGICS
ncbi:MFS transporter [Coxiella burnetii]|uniref:MFS transporter n=1 Tax=Coxiella burnetii TaxID=777 RepID=UPI0005096C50|nr:MFS transporter [Coxiella burnetii]